MTSTTDKKDTSEFLKKWSIAVERAKRYAQQASNHQMEIAALALSVCEINWGGRQKKDAYTLTRFSRETGIHLKTLSNWVAIRRAVYDKLSSTQKSLATYNEMAEVAQTIKDIKEVTPIDKVRKAFEKYADTGGYERKIMRYVCDLKSLHYCFYKQSAAFKCDDALLREALFYTRRIYLKILKDKPGLKPEATGTARHLRKLSAASVLGVPRKKKVPA